MRKLEPKFFDVKPEIVPDMERLNLEESAKEIYEKWITSVTTEQGRLLGYLQESSPDTLTVQDNPQPKEGIKVWLDPDYFMLTPGSSLDSLAKENTMYDDDDMEVETIPTEAERTRRYFINALRNKSEDLETDLSKAYGLKEDPPKTFEEFATRIREGKFVLVDRMKNKTSHPGYFDPGWPTTPWIEWKDPNRPVDEEGFRNARKAVQDHRIATEHEMMVQDLKELPGLLNRHTYH